ncbi:hypothetical protein KTO58_27480 [Chitinophaga pendula]|uniref:condensation domain-containing protein n=1 Tax=Chitinophaga TaxID=79328 RepID=UPI000BAFCACC|nr:MULTISPECIES: condensation domain-containing protein [Chitinophaga]ASZ09701.1 hypothetical protein CK934_01280 [Chitinophaga sp. MD30]UCJ07359.1 hypothetical protein KTO58_27480 [Chitinophaga pendula]
MSQDLHESFVKQQEDWKIHQQYDIEVLIGKVTFTDFDAIAFEHAYRTVLEQHESLRTVFMMQEEVLFQRVLAGTVAEGFEVTYLDSRPEPYTIDGLSPYMMEAMRDLTRGPLFRVLVAIYVDHTAVFLAMHHIISDEWSMKVLIQDLTRSYDAWLQGTVPALPVLPLQLKDYSRVKNEEWYGKQAERIRYWEQQLSPLLLSQLQERLIRRLAGQGVTVPSDPAVYDDFIKTTLHQPGGAMQYVARLTADAYTQLQQLAVQLRVSRLGVLIANAALLFHQEFGLSDLMISTLAGDRFRKQTEHLIGHLMGGVFLRIQLAGHETVSQLVRQVYLSFIQSLKHLIFSYDDYRDLPLQSGSMLHLNYMNEAFENRSWELPAEGHHPLDLVYYPLSIILIDDGEGGTLLWNYHQSFYTPAQVAHLHDRFCALLVVAGTTPEVVIAAPGTVS